MIKTLAKLNKILPLSYNKYARQRVNNQDFIVPKGGTTGFLSSDLKHYCCPSFGSWLVQGKRWIKVK